MLGDFSFLILLIIFIIVILIFYSIRSLINKQYDIEREPELVSDHLNINQVAFANEMVEHIDKTECRYCGALNDNPNGTCESCGERL